MTPNRSSRPVRRIVVIAALLAILAGGGSYWFRHNADAARASVTRPVPVPVSVATAGRQDVPVHVGGLGIVQALNTVPIHSQIDGKLIEITFTEGQRVKKGDVLARIDPRLFKAALDQAQAKKGQDEANLISAEKDLIRAKTLVARSFETKQAVDQQQAKVDALKASVAADEAAVETARAQLDYTIITAPIDGRAGIRQVDIGNIVHANDSISLVTLTQTQPSAVIFTLPETLIDPLRDAMLAGLPLMLGTGTGSELRQPLGYAMVGGLVLSQMLTLYTTPVVYLYLDRLQTWLSRKHGSDQAAAAEAQAAE